MAWNWTQPHWPHFTYDPVTLEPLERHFLLLSGEVIGAVRHVGDDDRDLLRIELLSEEAVRTGAIEGEALDRLSVQSSLRRQFGLDTDDRAVKPKERGIAQMMADLYRSWADPLDDDTLFRWHRMLMADSRHLEMIGGYRSHEDAMRIVSGRYDWPTVHFEPPPSFRVPEEMTAYLAWFNGSAPNGSTRLPALSAENYIAITGTSRPTATRDLHDLVEKGALTRTGERRYTRYRLNLSGTADKR